MPGKLKKALAEGKAWLDLPPCIANIRTGAEISARLSEHPVYHHPDDPRWDEVVGLDDEICQHINYLIEEGFADDPLESDAIRTLPKDEYWRDELRFDDEE